MPTKRRGPTPKAKPALEADWKARGFQSEGSYEAWKAIQTKGKASSKPHVFLAYLHAGMVTHEFMMSLINSLGNRRFQIQIAGAQSGPLIARNRNLLAEEFLKSTAEYLWFCDTDMAFDQTTIDKLHSADVDICGSLCYGLDRKDYSRHVAAHAFDEAGKTGEFVPEADLPESGLLEVASVGMACTLIKRSVIEALKPSVATLWPFAETLVPSNPRPTGEDVTFCIRARELGFRCFLNVEARVGHVKSFVI